MSELRNVALAPLALTGAEREPERLLHAMLMIRAVESVLLEARLAGRFEGPVHVSLGQEAVAVGVGLTLVAGDLLLSNHRGHGHALAFGLDPRRVVAEVVGHPSGYSGGRGGSMHILDPASGFLGTNGIVGDGAGLAVGAALALQVRGHDQVAITVFGDGAMGTGVVYEAFNMAALWRLPLVFVCENNGYAEMTPTAVHLSSPVTERASAFGLAVHSVAGADVMAVAEAMVAAVAAARGGTPGFVEVRCHRWGGHYVGDPALYRPPGEDADWREANCPVTNLSGGLGLGRAEIDGLAGAYRTEAQRLLDDILGAADAG